MNPNQPHSRTPEITLDLELVKHGAENASIRVNGGEYVISGTYRGNESDSFPPEHAAFIVEACNNYAALQARERKLVEALEAERHERQSVWQKAIAAAASHVRGQALTTEEINGGVRWSNNAAQVIADNMERALATPAPNAQGGESE